MKTVLEVENLYVDLPLPAGMLHAVRNVSFHVNQGETISLIGESGCGKSMTALAVMNLLPRKGVRTADVLSFEGRNLKNAGDSEMADIRGNKMAMIFQEPMTSLDPCYTIGNQLEEAYLQHRKAVRREARDRAVFLLEKVGITAAGNRMKQYPHQLSGGLRQRVMIAMGLMCGPSLIIADEPTTALDVSVQSQILNLLIDLRKEFGLTYILISHNLAVVQHMASRVAVMYLGRIVEEADSQMIFRNPLHPYTQALPKSVLTPDPHRGLPETHLGIAYPNPIDPPPGCTFHPRCPKADDRCTREAPQASVKDDHLVECHYPESAA